MDHTTYQIANKTDSRKLTEFLCQEGQFLLPMVELITGAEMAVDELIEVTGRATIEGFSSADNPDEVKRRVGLVSANAGLYPNLTVREMLLFFADLYGVEPPDAERELARLVPLLGLDELVTRRCGNLSTGQKQRVNLARALIHKPPLLFLDEPTSGLDPEAAQQVNDLIASLANQNGQTVVLATHNLTDAQRLCDRVAIMNKGRLLALGSLDELSRTLWSATWVDITFHVKPADDVADKLKAHRGVIQVTAGDAAVSIQVENEDVIPVVVRHLVEQGAEIRKVNPRDYTLEDIYFALQAGEA